MKNKIFLLGITAISAIGGLLFGYDTGVINGAQYFLSKHFDLDSLTKGWVVASALLGCLFGAIIAGPVSMKIGRKRSLILSALLFTLSAYGSGLPEWMPQTVPLLVFFRIVGGLGIGIASMNAPMYIAEIAPPHQRGQLVTYYQLAIVIGFFTVFLVTYFIGNTLTPAQNIEIGWRRMFWSELIPSGLFLMLLFAVPQSPRWLILKGKYSEAKETLYKLYGNKTADKEFQNIQDSLNKEVGNRKVSLQSKGVLYIILIGAIFSGLQQFTGINAVLYYGADIFEKALGIGKDEVLQQQILLALVNLVFTFVAMFTVDRLGRKPLIYIGSFGMISGFSLLAFSLQQNNIGMVSLIGILLFIASFAMSMGPVVWVVLSEMFPNRIRSLGMSIAVAVQWGSNYVVSQYFPVVMESKVNNSEYWNGSLPYFIFIAFILVILFITFKFIPETKGKTLEKLEQDWKQKGLDI